MNIRPKPGESEEDLIQQNAEFMRNSKRKSAESSEVEDEDDTKKQKSQECGSDYIFNDPDTILKHAMAPGVLLHDIVERSTTEKTIRPPVASSSGFPSAFKRDKGLLSGKKKSVFAQMQERQVEIVPTVSAVENIKLGAQQGIKNVFGPTEAQKIHEESLQKLSELTEEQIIEERKRLLASLNPETLRFFANRGSKGNLIPVTEDMEVTIEASEKKAEENEKDGGLMKNEDLPINPDEAKKWLHMDVVETEKLKWTKKLSAPKPLAPGDPYPARFDFEGNLLPPNAEFPVTKALHHHGDEPDRPGYTLEELLLFSRSAVMQQRAIGVSTIANILRLAKEGRFDLCLEESIIPQLVGAGVFSILRFSLDESVIMVVQAAADALENLLSSQPDEVCLSLVLGTKFGLNQPILVCLAQPEEEKEKGEEPVEEGELRDHELLQMDVIKGALRSDLIPRIRYLLEIIKPAPKTVLALLEILIRCARHSRESALVVGRCPGLLQTIIQQFLPKTWNATQKKPAEMNSVQGVPLSRAVRLIRVIAAQSKAMATDLVFKFNIMSPLMSYLASEPGETGIPDGAGILIESFYLWQTLLSYGLTVDDFNSFSPVYGQLLTFHLTNTNLGTEGSFYQEHATAILSLLRTVLKLDKSGRVPEDLIINIWPQIFRKTALWISQAAENVPLTFSDLKLVGAALDTTCALFQALLYWDKVDAMSLLTLMENLLTSSVVPLLSSKGFSNAVENLLKNSSLLQMESVSGRRRDPKGLPSCGAVTFGQSITSVLQPESHIFFLQPLISFISCTITKFSKLQPALVSILLLNVGLKQYLSRISTDGCPGLDHWFTRTEIHFAVDLLTLASKSGDFRQTQGLLIHRAAMNLVPCIRGKDKSLLMNLFQDHIFFDNYLSQDVMALGLMHNLKISGAESSNFEAACRELPVIRDTYLASFGLLQNNEIPMQPNSICLQAEGDSMLPVDWPFMPLVNAAGQSESVTKEKCQDLDSSIHNGVLRGLQFLIILQTLQPDVLEQMLSPTARFCRLACIFLADNCLFLEKDINLCLKQVLATSLAEMEQHGQNFDFDEKIPGLKDFWELYVQLVQQYCAESYGDKLFAHFVLIPMQQRYKTAFKNLIWGEQVQVIRFLSLPTEELMFQMKYFLEPMETDEALLMLYVKSLKSGLVKPTWSPILYKVALYHVTKYIECGQNIKLADALRTGMATFSPC